MKRTLAIAGLLLGVLAGAIVALAVPQRRAAPTTDLPPVNPVRVAPARPQPSGLTHVGLRADTSTVRIEARAADPRGGPPWAVRVFEARRVTRLHHRDLVVGRDLCAQLGRLYRKQFGWLDAHGVFRPVDLGYMGAPTGCGSRRMRRPLVGLESLVTAHKPRVYGSVLWGLARAGASGVRAHGTDVRLSPRGAFLLPGPASWRDATTTVAYTYAGRPPVVEDLGADQFRSRAHRRGAPIIDARAPDPNGGLPWGIAAVRTGQGWCATTFSRVVGDRLGTVDDELGVLREVPFLGLDCPRGREPLSHAHAVSISIAVGAGGRKGGPQHTARRTLPGYTVFYGTALRDVTSITIATPRDVRTLVPSPRAHAFIAVYDGDFPTGRATITAAFADGGHTVQRVRLDAF